MALVELELEAPPASPEAMEAYFQEHVATAEALAAEGPDNYVKAATHFYRALRVYPQPVELLRSECGRAKRASASTSTSKPRYIALYRVLTSPVYQKVCPEPVFQLVIKLTQLTSAAVGAGAGGAAAPRAGAALEDIDDIDEAAEPKAAAAATVAATVADAEAKLEGAAAVEAAILESEVATKIEAVLEAAEEAIEEAIEEDEAAEAGAETEVEGEAEVASERAESNNGSGASWDHVEAQPQH
jgi:hypothetical protein